MQDVLGLLSFWKSFLEFAYQEKRAGYDDGATPASLSTGHVDSLN